MILMQALDFFNAYEQLAKADDLDFIVHVGDYIYEVGCPALRAIRSSARLCLAVSPRAGFGLGA